MTNEYYSPHKFFINNAAYIKHQREFDYLLVLFNESEIVKQRISGLKMFSAEQKACSLIFLKSQHMAISILRLCNEGIAENAAILLRSLYENYIQMKFIIKSDLGRQFLNYRIAALKRYFDLYEKNFPASNLITPEYLSFKKKLDDKFETIKGDYVRDDGRIRERWSNIGIKGMAKAVDETLSYDYMMSIYSAFVHCDVTGMMHYVVESEDRITFDNSPTPNKVDEVLKLAGEYFGRIATEWMGIFNTEVPAAFLRFLKTKKAGHGSNGRSE